MMIAVPQWLFRLPDVVHRSWNAFFVAVNLNSPDEDCSYAQAAATCNDLFQNIFVLDCPLCNLPPTTLDNTGCHSNIAQVHQRQFSVHNMNRVKGSLHYACTSTDIHTHVCTSADTDWLCYSYLCHQLHIVSPVYLLV